MNATVTMPLSEIDALRNDHAASMARVKELESTQAKVRVEVREAYASHESVRLGGSQFYVPRTEWRTLPHTYINLDEVIKAIREEEAVKVASNTRKLEKEIKTLREERIKDLEKHKTAIEEMQRELRAVRERVAQFLTAENEVTFLKAALEAANKKIEDWRNLGVIGRIINPMV